MSPSTIVQAEQPEYAEYMQQLRDEDSLLAEEIVAFTGIKDVLEWMQRRGLLGAGGVDMIGQDEFHYDFLIQLEPQGRWLAFGVT